jgi:hypothetical protein
MTTCGMAAGIVGIVLFSPAQIDAAGPSERHEIAIPMPTRLKIQRTRTRISDSFDLSSLRIVKVMVGQDMFVGLKDEIRIYSKGDARPQHAGSVSYASVTRSAISPSQLDFLKSTNFLNEVGDHLRAPGNRYTTEHDISLFETDVHPQHMWNAEIGGNYRVLWQKTLKAESR